MLREPGYVLARLTGFLGQTAGAMMRQARRLHADRAPDRARHPRARRHARLSRARVAHRQRSEARRGRRPLAQSRRVFRAPRGRRARRAAARRAHRRARRSPRGSAASTSAGDAELRFSRAGPEFARRIRKRRAAHRLSAAQRRRRSAVLALSRSAGIRVAAALCAGRRHHAVSRQLPRRARDDGAIAGRRSASPRFRARSGSR